MPIEMQLLRNQRVLLRTLSDPLDANDLFESFRIGARDIVGPSPHVIHLIFDATKLHKIPSNFLSFGRSAEKMAVAKTGRVVVVSESGFLKTMMAIVSQVTSLKPIAVSTLDEALALVDRWLADEVEQLTENRHPEDISER